jgi:hypothetical protein
LRDGSSIGEGVARRMMRQLAIIFSLFTAVALHTLAAVCAEGEGTALTHFLYEQDVARLYVERCSKVVPGSLQEDMRVTYASYLRQLTQAQRILENQGVELHIVDRTPPSTRQQQVKDSASVFVETTTRGDPVRACRVYFGMLRNQTDAAEIALRKTRSMEQIERVVRSLKQSPSTPTDSLSEAVWSKSTVSDLSLFVTLQRYRIYTDHCSVKVPRLKPNFDGLMEDLRSRFQSIFKGLLSSDAFREMKDALVPAEIGFALKDSVEDARHNFERQDSDSICPKKLNDLGQVSDESLQADLTQTLAAVQNMTRNARR